MSDEAGIKEVDGLAAFGSQLLVGVKGQSKVRQLAGSVLLFGSAAIAILVNPTAAIVVAVLAIASVWLFPPLRKTILGDVLLLKDVMGNKRLVAHAGVGTSILGLIDSAGTFRAILAVDENGSPSLSLFDPDSNPRLVAALPPDAPVIFMLDDKRKKGLEIRLEPSGPTLYMDHDDRQLIAAVNEDRVTLASTDVSGHTIVLPPEDGHIRVLPR